MINSGNHEMARRRERASSAYRDDVDPAFNSSSMVQTIVAAEATCEIDKTELRDLQTTV